MAIATFKRYEKKYLISTNKLKVILPLLLEHMELDSHCIDGKEYTIYSIYYDTINHDIIRDNVAGNAYKEKMRIRSYYPNNGPEDKVFMEIKKKCNGVGNKRRIKIMNKEISPFVEDGILPQTKDYLSQQVAKELAYFIGCNRLEPALYVQYDRLALFGREDKNFRITFDRNIRTRHSNFKFGESDEDTFLIPQDMYIMEIKILGSVPIWLSKILSEEELYSQGFSKYGVKFKEDVRNHNIDYYLMDENGDKVDFDYFKVAV